jgi:hypothetical protein
MSETVKNTSAATVVFAWLLVCIPLGWGVYQSALNVAKLFK